MPIGTTNIKISDINTENTATTSNSLKTLSETAIEGVSTLNEAPYAMSEFMNYSHQWSSSFTFSSTTGGGKAGHTRYHLNPSDSTMTLSDGSDYTFSIISTVATHTGFRIRFTHKDGVALTSSSAWPTAWTSVTVESSAITNFTLNRTAFTQATVGNSKHFQKDDGVTYMAASGSGTITINF